jgi:hypothetical protein
VAILNRDRIDADAHLRAGERATRGDVELPTMPWAGEDFAVPRPGVLPARLRVAGHCPVHRPLAQRPERVRADVRQRVERAVDIEDADLDVANLHHPMRVLRELRHRGNDVGRHSTYPRPPPGTGRGDSVEMP